MRKLFRSKVTMLIGLLVVQLGVNAQSSTQSIYESGVNVSLIPPSPTTASFQKYGLTPVSMENGLPNVSIPIYEVKCGDLSMPITLSYHNNGFKPQEEAGWAGLGWNLNVGGTITRILKGSVDGSRASGQNFDQFNAFDSATQGALDYRPFLFGVYHDQTYDTEPDIFVYNFGGHQGKFIELAGTANMLNYERLKITQLSSDAGFVIVDENGTSYLFSTLEISRSIKTKDPTMGAGYVSSWQLTSVVSADRQNWINFYYAPYTYYQGDYVTGQTYSFSYGEVFNDICGEPAAPTVAAQSTTNTQSYNNQIAGESLASITTSDGQTIAFQQSPSARQDIGSTENALQQIVVYGQTGSADTVIKKISLSQGYFTEGTTPSSAMYNRMKLSGVYMQDGAGDTLNSYTFSYYHENDAFPSKNTFAQDMWGYFNNSGNGTPEELGVMTPQISFPTFSFGTQVTPVVPYANRSPNADGASYGVLSQINYPTGGYTTFQYQQNTYYTGSIAYVPSPPGTGTTVYYNDNPSNPVGNGALNIDHQQYIHLTIARDLDSGESLPFKNFTPILVITQCGNCGVDDDTPGFVPQIDTIYTSPPLYTTNSWSDSLLLNPGIYTYTVSCESTFMDASAYFQYTDTVSNYNGSPAPGLRVSTISDYDGNSANPVLQRAYVYEDSLGYTSGYLYQNFLPPVYASQTTIPNGQGACAEAGVFYYNFPSDDNAVSNASLNFKQYYTAVREYVRNAQDTTQNYFTEHYYAPVLSALPPVWNNIFAMPTISMACIYENLILTDPDEVKTISWKQTGDGYAKVRQTSTNYNYIQDTQITGVKPISLTPQIDDNNGDPTESRWAFDAYTIFCIWKYPMNKQDILYDDYGGALVKNTVYTFDSTKRELREMDEDAGNGKTIITKYKYPDDYEILPYTQMDEYHILSPIAETQIWEKENGVTTILKGVVTNYDSLCLKPSQKFFLYNSSPLTSLDNEQIDNPPLYMTMLDDSHYHEKVRYTYNASGKIVEEIADSLRNVPTAYVWGYGDVYPVAKVVGAHFSSVLGVIDTGALQSIRTDAALRSALAPLRNIPGAQVTIYTYRPFVGISSVTDMNGRTSYYDYDKFYRLSDIKDFNGNILKTYQYNYKKGL